MDKIIGNFLEQLKVGRKQSHKNLAVYPLLSTYAIGLDYLLLDEALSQSMIEVVELSEGGSVPELKVVNTSGRMEAPSSSGAMKAIYDKERTSL
ncbi:MAG: DUF6569 family protein [Deltaproteobacteria bacterium]|nr:DUF6569 family protein [Deltaproteobacteria bacterium]